MPFDDKSHIISGQWRTCCVKQYSVDRKDYQAFGALLSAEEPVTIYLRGDDPADDWKDTKQYPTIDDMLADRWLVD